MEQLSSLIEQEGTNTNKVRNLFSFLNRIHNLDGYDQWVDMYASIIQNLKGSKCGNFLVIVLKGADSRIAILSTQIFKFVIENHGKLEMTLEQTLEVMHLCVHSFSHLEGTDDETL